MPEHPRRKAAAPQCKLCARRTRNSSGYCYQHGPAGPHAYRATRIYTQDGLLLRCRKPGCEDASHATRAALGFTS